MYIIIGFVLSLVYFMAVVGFELKYHTYNEFKELKPNELGDLLAGIFAPVAFLWLALAVLLQRAELQAQREELHNSTEQLQRQADALNLQHKTNSINLIMQIDVYFHDKLIYELDEIMQSSSMYGQNTRDKLYSQYSQGIRSVFIVHFENRFKLYKDRILDDITKTLEAKDLKANNLQEAILEFENLYNLYNQNITDIIENIDIEIVSSDFERIYEIIEENIKPIIAAVD